jgi:hypothetical protein
MFYIHLYVQNISKGKLIMFSYKEFTIVVKGKIHDKDMHMLKGKKISFLVRGICFPEELTYCKISEI